MSFRTWHNYGFGLCVDKISDVPLERVRALLQLAPGLEKEIEETARELGYANLDTYLRCSLRDEPTDTISSMLRETILAAEGLELCTCRNYEDECFLIYQPSYPWQMNAQDLELTEESLTKIFGEYVRVLTDDEIPLEYQEVENGG